MRRPLITLVCGGIIAFFLASGLSHKALQAAVSLTATFGVVLPALATPLREISPVLQRWFTLAAGVAAGAALGLAVRLISG